MFLSMNTGSGIIDIITSALGTILYPLFSIVFVLIDAVQNIFYAFAGIGNSGITFVDTTVTNANDGGETTTGVLYYLFQQPVIRNLLLSIMLLALLLIVIFTVMAFIKNTYSPKPKTWTEIVGNALKGLANFIFLPVCCLLGVWGGNILLGAINGATSNGGSADMSRKLFIACAYNANHFRTGTYTTSDYKNIWDIARSADGCTVTGDSKESITEFTITITNGDDKVVINVKPDMTAEQYAQIVDQIYSESQISIHWQGSVGGAYSLWQFNYLLLIIGGVFMLYVLGSLAFAMVRRLFILLALFVISPALCAMYPLDEGAVVGQWKKKFISETISAYGAVAGMNIFFSIVPIVDKIRVFTGAGSIVNEIFRIFILVVGLFCVKEIIGLISGYVGGENAYEKGTTTMKQAKEAVSKYGGKVAKGATSSAFRIGSRVRQSRQTSSEKGLGKASTFFSALGAGLGATGREIGRHATLGLSENVIDATKAGKEKGFGGVVDELTKPFRKSGVGKDIDDQIKEEKKRAEEAATISKSQKRAADLVKSALEDGVSKEDRKIYMDELSEKGYIDLAAKDAKINVKELNNTKNSITPINVAELGKTIENFVSNLKKFTDPLSKNQKDILNQREGESNMQYLERISKLSSLDVKNLGLTNNNREVLSSTISELGGVVNQYKELSKSLNSTVAHANAAGIDGTISVKVEEDGKQVDKTIAIAEALSSSLNTSDDFAKVVKALESLEKSITAKEDKLIDTVGKNVEKYTKEINKKEEKK